MAQVTGICIRPPQQAEAPSFQRQPVERAVLIADFGIEGDSKAGHPKRQINLIADERAAELAEQGYDATLGQLGEQMRVSGFDLSTLEVGDRLMLGPALIEITSLRNGCDRFERVQGRERAGGLGVMARVVQGGPVQIGDPVLAAAAENETPA